MDKAICQRALDRVMLYLQSYGLEPTPSVYRRALALIDDCLSEAGVADMDACDTGLLPGGVLAMVFDRLPQVFDLSEPDLPIQRPPILRGSIGYGPPV